MNKCVPTSPGMASETTLHIGIFYHQQLVGEGIAAVLSTRRSLIPGPVLLLDPETIDREIDNHQMDLLILELAYISRHVLNTIRKLRASFPRQKILTVSGMISHHYLHDLMQVVDGYVLRTCSHDLLFKAVDEVLASGRYLCPQLMEEIMDHRVKHPLRDALTLRENEILLSWFSMNSTEEIARKLFISPPTVRTHLKNIREKFGKPSLMKMLFYACQETQFNSDTEPICPYCKSFCTINSKEKKS